MTPPHTHPPPKVKWWRRWWGLMILAYALMIVSVIIAFTSHSAAGQITVVIGVVIALSLVVGHIYTFNERRPRR